MLMFSNNRLRNRTAFVLLTSLRFFLGIRSNLYSTYITAVAIFALALGVSIVTVVLGTINGFEKEISKTTIKLSGHAMVFPKSPGIMWLKDQEHLEKQDIVKTIVPFMRTEALISHRKKTFPISFEGTSLKDENRLESSIIALQKEKESFPKDGQIVILGDKLADRLGVSIGEKVTLLIPQLATNKPPRVVSKSVFVGNTISFGLYDIDSKLVLTNLETAEQILGKSQKLVGFRITYKDGLNSERQTTRLLQRLNGEFQGLDWSTYNRNFFLALKSQKRILFIILSLVIAVATFNIAASIFLIVEEKKPEIKILRTIGCDNHLIAIAFLLVGFFVSVVGSILGLIFAFGLAYAINPIIDFLEWSFSTNLLDPAIYLIDYLPISIFKTDLLITVITTSALCLLASVFPAYKATKQSIASL